MATERSAGTVTQGTAPMTDLRSEPGLDLDHLDTFAYSLVLDEALQLKEAPVAYPIVHPLPSPLLADAGEVFQHYPVAVEPIDNLFAYVVVDPSHVTSFTTTKRLETTLGSPCAFGLELAAQVLELPLCLLDSSGMEEPAVTDDGKVVHSEIDAKNTLLRASVSDIDLFGEREQEMTSASLVNTKQTLAKVPGEISYIAIRYSDLELLPAIKQPQDKDITFEIGASREVVPHRSPIDERLCRTTLDSLLTCAELIETPDAGLDHAAGLLDAGNSQLCWQSEPAPYIFVDDVVQLDVVLDIAVPCAIDAELESFAKCFDCGDNFRSRSDFDFRSDTCSHGAGEEAKLYKLFAQFPYRTKKTGGESYDSSLHQRMWSLLVA